MYVSLSRLRIEPDRAPELVAAFRRRAGLVDAFEGFVDLQVWQSDRDPGEIVMVSRWDTRAHFTCGWSGRKPCSSMSQMIRRCTGLRPSRTSGRARDTMTDMA